MNTTLQLIAFEIAEEYGMDIKWLNSGGHIFSRNFPDNWKNRTKPVFKRRYLSVRVLSRKDLIATKFYSYCMRNLKTDRDDLVDMKPSRDELNFSKKWALSLNNSPKPEFATACFEEIIQSVNKFYKEP